MNTQSLNTDFSKELKETLSAVFAHTRSKIISTADVWNIQRRKRARVQRRFAL
jgi:Holliday junction resolvase-like predicted endonuclease